MHITGFLHTSGASIHRRLIAFLLFALALGMAPAAFAQLAAVPEAARLGVGEMFVQSHIVVKAVMIFLALLSLLTWSLLVEKLLVFGRARKANAQFLEEFRRAAQGRDLPAGDEQSAMGRMWLAARNEIDFFRKTHTAMPTPHQADRLLQRLALVAGIVQERELSRLSSMMGVLATIGSTSPFIGLFGTVWGILNSFAHIAVAKSTSLSVVAPGIAEALLATAIGLFAAIPAVMIYNKFVRDINGFVGALDNFSAEMIAAVSRKFDAAG
jgi:TolQ protein